MSWLKIDHDLPDKPEPYQIAEALGMDPDLVVGKLLRVWIWADKHAIIDEAENGNAHVTPLALLDRVAGVTGFAQAMIDAGWLVQNDRDLQFPNFGRHNGKTAKQRALGSSRVATHRAKPETSNASVTQAPLQERYQRREEKRREDIATEQQGAGAPAAGAADLFRDTTEMVPKTTTPAAEPPKPKRQAPTRFTPPTVEEALAYAATISMDEDNARRWYDFHSARGWTMGKATTQMKDWRAAMRYWKSNEYPSATGGATQALNPKRTGSLPYLQIATNAEWVASMADEPVYQKDLDDHLAMDELTKEMAPESWEKMKDRRATEYQEKVQKMKDRESREGKQP